MKRANGFKHGLIHTREYKSWTGMRRRCRCNKDRNFPGYGGRGIKICARWDSFENFFKDMGKRPAGMTLERKNNNGNYCPKNCKWAGGIEQAGNTRRNIKITMNGKTKPYGRWAVELGISRQTVHARLKRGWAPVLALTKPIIK